MRVFVSYRRVDSAGWAGRIVDELSKRFGMKNIFHDMDSIQPGENWRASVRDALENVDYTLVVIGPAWLAVAHDLGGRRLDDPEDLVRIEVATALSRGKPVIPVLVGGARMPDEAALPADLKPLTDQQAVELTDRRWHHDMQQLLALLSHSGWWRKLLAAGAGLVQVAFLGVWIYSSTLGNTVAQAESQSVYYREAYIRKMQVGTDECMAGTWPTGAVKGKTYQENGGTVTDLCARVSGSLSYFGRFFNNETLWWLPASASTARKFDDAYVATFEKDFEPFLIEGWTDTPTKEALVLARRVRAEFAAEAQKVVELKRRAGAAAVRLKQLSGAVLIGQVWTIILAAAVVVWLVRRRT
jgi:hypothetical protein